MEDRCNKCNKKDEDCWCHVPIFPGACYICNVDSDQVRGTKIGIRTIICVECSRRYMWTI